MNIDTAPLMDWDAEPLASVTHELLQLWPGTDSATAWVDRQFQLLNDAGILGWVIPEHYGGCPVTSAELNRGYERLAASCLVTTFVLTQRNGACQRIAMADNDEVKSELLPQLARGELFGTVGISHLTTSRQHLDRPAVAARFEDGCVVMNGIVPWVTGSPYADIIVTGGTCSDGRQILVALPTALDGVEIIPPTQLMALNGSQTGSVRLGSVRVPERYVLAGPVEGVMRQGQGSGTGSLTTSALALGLAARAHDGLQAEAEHRSELEPILAALDRELCGVSLQIQAALQAGSGQSVGDQASAIREAANSLVLRSAQAYLAACKGLGFKSGHPAERLVRESMFFLVWSCPQPVVQANLRQFACLADVNLC